MTPALKRNLTGWLFILPWLAGFLIFMAWPMVASLRFSLSEFDIVTPPVFVGLRNFTDLFGDPFFIKSMGNLFVFIAFAIPMLLVFSVFFAVGIENSPRWVRGFLTSSVFFPSLIPAVAAGMLFLWLFNDRYGMVNRLFGVFGLDGFNWLGDPAYTKAAVILGTVWALGGAVVINVASLKDIPRSLYEAAELDGASAFQRFLHVTLPMLSPVLFFHLTTGLIAAFQLFALPYILFGSGGGPERSALFVLPYMYETAFSFQEMGYACAMAWALFLALLASNFLVFKFIKPLVVYERG